MYKKLLSLSVLALSFNLAQSNLAFAHYGHHCDGNGYSHEALEKLDLTTEQKTKIKEIIEKTDQSLMRDHADLQNIRKQTNEEFIANTMNDAKIDKIVDKKLPIIGDIMKLRMRERLEISQILTDEQKVKLAEMIAKHASEAQQEQHN